MSPDKIRELLAEVKAGRLDVDVAVDELAQLPFRDIGVATVDHHRALRQGTPEVIFGAGKSAEQLLAISGEILRGLKLPTDCPAFGEDCTPLHPLGATMVSTEGACAAYHAYGRERRLPVLRP